MPNGLPYPGSWIFAYPVARPTEFGLAAAISASNEADVAAAVEVVAAVSPEPLVAQVAAEASESAGATPKFFALKPVVPAPVDQAVESIPEFEISPALVAEPQTNSIVLAPSEDPLQSEIFTDDGYFVRTGSIEIVPVQTGEIAVVSDNVESDKSDSADVVETYVSSIAPVSSSSVVNSKTKPDILPTRRRRAKDSSTTSLTLLISIVLVAALSITAYFFGLFG
mgnify:CR=1 FL=1